MTEKARFAKALSDLSESLNAYATDEKGEWTIKGFIDIYKRIYTISTDTKVLSKILEIHLFPKLIKFADDIGYTIVLADHQNWYPDLTFVSRQDDSIKFAVDLKTTYVRDDGKAGFTLGSHGSYFIKRDHDKNIQFPYNQYSGHFCLAIVYTRNTAENVQTEESVVMVEDFKNGEKDEDQPNPSLVAEVKEEYKLEEEAIVGDREITSFDKLTSIASVIKDLQFFVQEKWMIASDRRGSGNTANIGSIDNLEDLKSGNGVFRNLGEHWFDEYWMNYKNITLVYGDKQKTVTSIWEFLAFKSRFDLFSEVVASGAKRLSGIAKDMYEEYQKEK